MANHIPGRGTSAPRPNSSNPGYRSSDERARRDDEPNIDTSRIRFGDQIAPTLYSDVAEAAARSIADTSMRDANKATQLRRFYDELVMLQGKVGNSEDRFHAQAPYIQMLKAKVAYAMGRKKVDANFDRLLRHIVDQATDHRSLAQAKLFMEAFMAFYKVHRPQD
ncbi:MAG: type III-A CRISPR-associated protein Csm2 [Betaproteobacteria bacterium]|nr:MAG: type III-A CRISPR-associated protein Csm2 [Betaproteobacteria bacterium]